MPLCEQKSPQSYLARSRATRTSMKVGSTGSHRQILHTASIEGTSIALLVCQKEMLDCFSTTIA